MGLRIKVAGEDRTSDIGESLKELSGTRQSGNETGAQDAGSAVLALTASGSESEFADRHIALLRQSCFVDNAKIDLPSGSAARSVRKLLWKILRPVFDWISHRQNNINAQIVQALEMEKKIRDREIRQLRKDIDELKGKG